MIVKALVAASLAAAPSAVSSDIAFNQYPQVRQVRCATGSGSAVQTTKGWVSVNHVTVMPGCRIDGWLVVVTDRDEGKDFSEIVTLAPRAVPARINCDGFKAGEYYWSTGYARGLGYQTNVRIRSLGVTGWKGFHAFSGDYTVIPGMSGGAVFNSAGEIVGMVNAYSPLFGLSFSRPLSETSLCK